MDDLFESAAVFSIVFSLLWLALVVFCLLDIFRSSMPGINKLIWAVIVLVAPLLGCIFYFIFGRRSKR
ncbi:MAG TPA: PLD nuclease N-terminal domain-containing protein [Sphingobacteriaceae bacterium]